MIGSILTKNVPLLVWTHWYSIRSQFQYSSHTSYINFAFETIFSQTPFSDTYRLFGIIERDYQYNEALLLKDVCLKV